MSASFTGAASADASAGSGSKAASATPHVSPDPDALGSDAAQLAKDEGISLEEATAALERQPEVGQLQSALQSKGPASYGGLFIDYAPQYRITILARPGGAPEVLKAVSDLGFGDLTKLARLRETTFTQDALEHAQTQVQDAAGRYLSTLDFDIRTGEILATGATAEDVEHVRSAIASLQEPLTAAGVVVKQGSFEDASGDGLPTGSCVKGSTESGCPNQQSDAAAAIEDSRTWRYLASIALVGLAGLAIILILWRRREHDEVSET